MRWNTLVQEQHIRYMIAGFLHKSPTAIQQKSDKVGKPQGWGALGAALQQVVVHYVHQCVSNRDEWTWKYSQHSISPGRFSGRAEIQGWEQLLRMLIWNRVTLLWKVFKATKPTGRHSKTASMRIGYTKLESEWPASPWKEKTVSVARLWLVYFCTRQACGKSNEVPPCAA